MENGKNRIKEERKMNLNKKSMKKRMTAVIAVLICLAGVAACGAGTGEEAAESVPEEGTTGEDFLEEAPVSEADSVSEEDPVLKDRIPMVMVDGTLYLDTGEESTVTARCGTMDGEIISAVDASEIPSEEGQSNFGTGYGWQYGEGDTIEIYMNGKWAVFRAQEES